MGVSTKFRGIAIALQLLFPIECIGCGSEGVDVCDRCINTLSRRVVPAQCFHCKIPWDARTPCPTCARKSNVPRALWAIGPYADPLLQRTIRALKYGGRFPLADHLAQLLAVRMRTFANSLEGELPVVVPVPLSWQRRIRRGYNQAETIAEAIARQFGWRQDVRCIERIRNTRSQVDVSAEERLSNIAGAFRLTEQASKTRAHERVLIVDDVWTTGSTMKEAIMVLREWGVNEVYGAVAAIG